MEAQHNTQHTCFMVTVRRVWTDFAKARTAYCVGEQLLVGPFRGGEAWDKKVEFILPQRAASRVGYVTITHSGTMSVRRGVSNERGDVHTCGAMMYCNVV